MNILFSIRGQRLDEQWRKASRFVDFRAHTLYFLHVFDPTVIEGVEEAQHYTLPRRLSPQREAEMRAAERARSEERLAQAKALAAADGVAAETILAEGPVGPTILRIAQERCIDLLILGRQHPGLERFLLGGVARFVVDKAPCSVLLLR